ncbi:oxidative stress-responsive serine-rich protein 1 [Plakobranchus ocellatus]|uniref:Oxidative stress-responsive serine-rich protein 1 n=1 Tax=Plakobranchus ocellatus TaxID=259542 RepID=A0AAV3ZHW7_9GAST|nr:oxidative stress-responsive serine-rich protein 1 [Plakobranchus ocellatus]
MGGEEKDSRSQSNGICKQPRRENVSDAVISKLLKDFTSAELFPQSTDQLQPKALINKSDCSWNEVITSFKHLHVRRPDQKRRRRARKHLQHSKKSAYLLNLAIAAGNFQRPIVWPSRLNCDCKKSSASLLNPSRLKVDVNHARSLKGNSSKICNHTSLSYDSYCSCKGTSNRGEKSNEQHISSTPFGHASSISDLTFSSLCRQKTFPKTEKEGLSESKASANIDEHPQSRYFAGKQLFTNSVLVPLSLPELPLTGTPLDSQMAGNTGAPAIYAKPSVSTSLTSFVPCTSSSSTRLHFDSTSLPTQPASSSAGLGRSCSQEVREMEDTNVNELASYLEDLLHIPRKMSSMAEMMYA